MLLTGERPFVCLIDATRFELCGSTKLYDSGEIGGEGKGRGSFVDEVTAGWSVLVPSRIRWSNSQLSCTLRSFALSTTSHSLGLFIVSGPMAVLPLERSLHHGPTQSPCTSGWQGCISSEGEFGSDCSAASATENASSLSGVGSGEEGV